MERKDGYLDLNKYFEEIKLKKNCKYYDLLVAGIIEPSTYCNDHFWLNIEGEKYYYKPSYCAYHELLAYHIAKELGYNATYCDLATFTIKSTETEDNKGIISKSYRKSNCKYITGTQILEEYYNARPNEVKEMGLNDDWKLYYDGPYFVDMNNLEIIWQALEFKYKNNPKANIEKLVKQLAENYIFFILIMANDKGSQNWEIEESENEINVCPIIDNEMIFYNTNTTVAFSTSFEDSDKSIKESIRKFLTISSREYINLFINKFNALDIEMLYRCIEKVEKQTETNMPEELKNEIIKNYTLNREAITEVLQELGLVNKVR